jgi:hypothetical protein
VALAAGDESLWTDVVLAACGAATLFWVFVAPPWLALHWKPASRLAMAIVGWVALTGAWVALVALQAARRGSCWPRWRWCGSPTPRRTLPAARSARTSSRPG